MDSNKTLVMLWAIVFLVATLGWFIKSRSSSRKDHEKDSMPWTGDGDGGICGDYDAPGDDESRGQTSIDGCSSDGGFEGGDGGGGD